MAEMKSTGAQLMVPIKLDEETNLHYIVGKTTVLFQNGIKLDRKAFENRVANHKTVAMLLEEAKRTPESCNWDFKKAVQTTELVRLRAAKSTIVDPGIKNQIRAEVRKAVNLQEKLTVPSPAPKLERNVKFVAPKAAEVRATPPDRPPEVPKTALGRAKGFFSAPYTDIIIMILFVGALCLSMSVYHTDMFLLETGKTPLVAIIGAVAMVTFSASSYTAARHVFQDHGIGFLMRIFFAGFLVIAGTATIAFSVFSTVHVSSEQFKAKQQTVTQVSIAADTKVVASAVLLDDKAQQITDANDQVKRYQAQVDTFFAAMTRPLPTSLVEDDPALKQAIYDRAVATRNYNSTRPLLEQAVTARTKLYDAKAAQSTAHENAIETAAHPAETTYQMVASKLGLSVPDLELVVYTVPAVFFDIIAPFAIAVVLLLKDRQKGIKKLSFMDRLIEAAQNKLLGGR